MQAARSGDPCREIPHGRTNMVTPAEPQLYLIIAGSNYYHLQYNVITLPSCEANPGESITTGDACYKQAEANEDKLECLYSWYYCFLVINQLVTAHSTSDSPGQWLW